MTATTETTTRPGDPTRRNVVLLAACQALAMSGNAIVLTVSALTGVMLAQDDSLATLPLALQFTATMAGTFPAATLMRRAGRRVGFSVGALLGMAGAGLAVHAIMVGSFPLFALSALPIGVFNTFVQYFRFAAADTASESFKPRAISLVLAGGAVAAVAGPQLAVWTRELMAPVLFAGCYVAIGGLCLVTLALLQFIEIPRLPAAQRADTGRPLADIARQSTFVVAVLAAAVAYGAMALVMTATPLAMVACGFVFDSAASVIQWHALAMFLPSVVTGSLIARFGALNVILAGGAMITLCLGINLSGVTYMQFWSALVLLGLGWNFMFVGGTTLATETYAPAEQAKTQALNDFLVFTTVAAASFSSAALHSNFGWIAVNLGVAPPLTLAMLAVLRLKFRPGDAAA